MAGDNRQIGKILVDLGVVGQGQLQAALAEQRRTGGRIGQILVARGAIQDEDLSRALALQQGLEWVPESGLEPDADAVSLLDAGTARAFGALPLKVEGGQQLDIVRISFDPVVTAGEVRA